MQLNLLNFQPFISIDFINNKKILFFFSSRPQTKDVALNIAIAQSIVMTILGYEPHDEAVENDINNPYCDDKCFGEFLNSIIRMVADPNPASRTSTGIWLLALIKNCSKREAIHKRKDILQYAFTELLSDDSGELIRLIVLGEMKEGEMMCLFTDDVDKEDLFVLVLREPVGIYQCIYNFHFVFISEFVQDVASRGLGLVYELSETQNQGNLAESLLQQLLGGKRQVNQVNEDTKLFEEGVLGKTPSGWVNLCFIVVVVVILHFNCY